MVKRRKRDIYGNWIWVDDDEIKTPTDKNAVDPSLGNGTPKTGGNDSIQGRNEGEELSLDWRDFVALSIASLETFLLPIVVFILVLVGIVIGLTIIH